MGTTGKLALSFAFLVSLGCLFCAGLVLCPESTAPWTLGVFYFGMFFIYGGLALGVVRNYVRDLNEYIAAMEPKVKESFTRGMKAGVRNLSGYRVIADPIVRAYVQDKLAGSTVGETITHIQHVGVLDFYDAIIEQGGLIPLYFDLNTVGDSIMDLAAAMGQNVVVDGKVFDPYSPTPKYDVSVY